MFPIRESLLILMFLTVPSLLTPPPFLRIPLNSSWTEDTRSCIFSDTALHLRKEGQRPLAAELDIQIEQKFNEFDELAAKAKTLLNKEHHLTQMVSRYILYQITTDYIDLDDDSKLEMCCR